MYCYVCRKAQILLAKSKMSLEKSLNVKVLFIKIKLKVWNVKNVSMWYQKKPIPQLSIFCLIQSINNYVQIYTYWRYIVQIMASNILLLVSKKFVLTSQGLVGAGMNCRALIFLIKITIVFYCQNYCEDIFTNYINFDVSEMFTVLLNKMRFVNL